MFFVRPGCDWRDAGDNICIYPIGCCVCGGGAWFHVSECTPVPDADGAGDGGAD